MYYGTIFEGKEFKPEACGYKGPNPYEDIDFDAEKMKKAVKVGYLDSLILQTSVGKMIIKKIYECQHYQNFDLRPESEITFDGFDPNVAEELKDLLLDTCSVEINENLVKSLDQVMSNFKIMRKKNE